MRAFLVLLLLAGAAHAKQDDDATLRARSYFEAGRALYTLGRYDEALREFVAGYQLLPRPPFLLDMAHCYRKLGQAEKARGLYLRYLAESGPDDPRAPEIRRILEELAQAPPPEAPAKVQVQVQVQAPMPSAPPPLSRREKWRRYGWIAPVAAVVLTGIGVGIYFGVRQTDPYHCAGAGLGCVDATH